MISNNRFLSIYIPLWKPRQRDIFASTSPSSHPSSADSQVEKFAALKQSGLRVFSSVASVRRQGKGRPGKQSLLTKPGSGWTRLVGNAARDLRGIETLPACSLPLSYQELTYSPVLIWLQTKLWSQKSQSSSFPMTHPVPGSISVFNSTISSDKPCVNVSKRSPVHRLHPREQG